MDILYMTVTDELMSDIKYDQAWYLHSYDYYVQGIHTYLVY